MTNKKQKGLKRVLEQSSPDNNDKKISAKESNPLAKDDTQKSQKRLRINQSLTSKLHVLTNSKEMQISAHAPGIKTGAKNDNIWDFRVMIPYENSYLSRSKSIVMPIVENFRHRCVAKSRDHLMKLCKEKGIIPPLMAWERWQANSILHLQMHQRISNITGSSIENKKNNSVTSKINDIQSKDVTENENRIKNGELLDYILPSDSNHVDDGLIQDLERGGIEEDTAAHKIALEMSEHSYNLVKQIRIFQSSCSSTGKVAENNGNKKKKKPAAVIKKDLPIVIQHKHTFDISLGEKSKNLLKLNRNYYRKLKELYQLTRSYQGEIDHYITASDNNKDTEEIICIPADTNSNNDDDDDVPGGFHACLYTMLAR